MARSPKLNVQRRRNLVRQGRANPDGSYPTDTFGRAVAAKGRARQAVKAGRLSVSQEARIDARANRELKRTGHGHSAKQRTGKTRSRSGR